MAEESKDDIFEWVMGFEDECIKRVREEVILTAEYNFGKRGREVAEKYYRAIDGEETVEDAIEDCNDCKERARKLIEKAEFLTKISENLYDDTISEILKMSKIDTSKIDEYLENVLKEISSTSCFKIDDEETKRKIKIAILLDCCQKLQKDDKSSRQ